MNLEEDELNKIFEEKLFLKVKHKKKEDNKENRLENHEVILENKYKPGTFNALKEIPLNVIGTDKSTKNTHKTKNIYEQKDKLKEMTINEINGKIDDVYKTKEKIESGKFIPNDNYLNENIDDVYKTKEKIETSNFIGDICINEKYVNTISNIDESTINDNEVKFLNKSVDKLNKELDENNNEDLIKNQFINKNYESYKKENIDEIINTKKIGENIINKIEFTNLNNVVKEEKSKAVTFKDDVKINLLKNKTNMININEENSNENDKSISHNKMKIIEQEFIKFKTAHFESLKMKSKIYKFINLEIYNLEKKYRNKISDLEKENMDLKKKVLYLEHKYEKYKIFVKDNLEILKNKIMVEMKEYKKKHHINFS